LIKKILTNKELYWTFLYQFITLVGGILLVKFLAVTLSITDYGYYSLVASITALVVMLPFSALMQGVSRYVSIYKQKKEYDQFFIGTVLLHLSIIVIYIIIAVVVKYFYIFSKEWEDIYFLVIGFTTSEIVKILLRTINNMNRERKNLSFSIFLEFGLKIGLLYLVHIKSMVSVSYVLDIFIIANIVSILIMLSKTKVNFSTSLSTRKLKVIFLRIWIFSSPLAIWAVFGWLRDMSNRWYLDYFLTKEDVALFAMMSSIAMIAPTALAGLINGFLMPIIYQRENKERGYARKVLLKLLPIVFVVLLFSFIVTYYFKDEIILLISDKKYLEISWMLPWMFLTFSVYSLAMMSTYEIFAHKKTKKLLYSSVVPGVVSIILGYFFIKYYGMNGALSNYIITYLTYSLLTFYVVYKYWKSNQKKEIKIAN